MPDDSKPDGAVRQRALRIPAGSVSLDATLALPEAATAVVAFAHGSGSGRFSPRNQYVATSLQRRGLATLLLDLLSEDEEAVDRRTGGLRFDVDLLAERLLAAVAALEHDPDAAALRVGLFGASTGAAAALIAAAKQQKIIGAVVSRGGRPDLARDHLTQVRAPTLLIVGERDTPVIDLNQAALRALPGPKEMTLVAGAGHLFEEPGALEEVAALAGRWFEQHLGTGTAARTDR